MSLSKIESARKSNKTVPKNALNNFKRIVRDKRGSRGLEFSTYRGLSPKLSVLFKAKKTLWICKKNDLTNPVYYKLIKVDGEFVIGNDVQRKEYIRQYPKQKTRPWVLSGDLIYLTKPEHLVLKEKIWHRNLFSAGLRIKRDYSHLLDVVKRFPRFNKFLKKREPNIQIKIVLELLAKNNTVLSTSGNRVDTLFSLQQRVERRRNYQEQRKNVAVILSNGKLKKRIISAITILLANVDINGENKLEMVNEVTGVAKFNGKRIELWKNYKGSELTVRTVKTTKMMSLKDVKKWPMMEMLMGNTSKEQEKPSLDWLERHFENNILFQLLLPIENTISPSIQNNRLKFIKSVQELFNYLNGKTSLNQQEVASKLRDANLFFINMHKALEKDKLITFSKSSMFATVASSSLGPKIKTVDSSLQLGIYSLGRALARKFYKK